MKLKIRKATLKDVPSIAKLGVLLAKEHRKFSKRIKIRGREKKLLESYEKEIKNLKNAIFVALDRKEIVGYIECFIDDSFIEFYNYPRGFIGEIYILPKFRNKSIGSKLLSRAMKWFKSKRIKEVHLEVFSGNTSAVEFYKKAGFEIKKYIMWKITTSK